MGYPEKGPGTASTAGDGFDPPLAAPWPDDGTLFEAIPPMGLRWQPEARILLKEALAKVAPNVRSVAQQQIEALARRRGIHEIDAELVGLSLGGMSSTPDDDP